MAKAPRVDKELELYRNLMTVPGAFTEGFNWSSLIGAVFIALVMVPGAMYMNYVAGSTGVGSAAQWVMVILFIEIAKRTHRTLPKAQIFVLFYMTGAAMATPFAGLLWNQFFVRSQAVIGQGWQDQIPIWYAPHDAGVLETRNFFMAAWLPAIGMVLFSAFTTRLDNAVQGYGMFKIASDIEKLPFPMAPVGAMGVVALAEDMEQKEAGKTSPMWRLFSIGGALGLVFGFVYIGLPTLSGALVNTTLTVLPIPFADWTGKTESFLPAVATGFSYDLTAFVLGMILPFWAVVGGLVGVIVTIILNPMLWHMGKLPSWQKGDTAVTTIFKNTVDFYYSFSLGISFAIAAIGVGAIIKSVRERRRHAVVAAAVSIPKGRGDIPFWGVGTAYLCTTSAYVLLCGYLIHWHTGIMLVLIGYGLLYTPLISYATARLEGMVGQTVGLPFVREAGMLLSGYQGITCWFLPLPIANYGNATVFYRTCELTGTKFTSIWKTEAILIPIILVSSIMYSQFIWSIAPMPSSAFPFTEKMWQFQAQNVSITYSATAGRYSTFLEAFRPWVMAGGFSIAIAFYFVLRAFSAPTFLLFGAIQSMTGQVPFTFVTQFMGALFAKFYLERKMGGTLNWRRYAPVMGAGFFCGTGLVAMFAIGVKFMTTAILRSPF